MSGLLAEVLAAHGGLERWRAVTALTAHGTFGGLLRARFPANRMTNVTVRVQLAEQHAVFHGFPEDDQRAVFDRGDVRIETRDGELIKRRSNARAAFAGRSGLRRNLRWDALDAAYFAGYAWWNYLTTPFLLTREGLAFAEVIPRRRQVSGGDASRSASRETSTPTPHDRPSTWTLPASSAVTTTSPSQSVGGHTPPTTAATTDTSTGSSSPHADGCAHEDRAADLSPIRSSSHSTATTSRSRHDRH
jgi:hypothetical protein